MDHICFHLSSASQSVLQPTHIECLLIDFLEVSCKATEFLTQYRAASLYTF